MWSLYYMFFRKPAWTTFGEYMAARRRGLGHYSEALVKIQVAAAERRKYEEGLGVIFGW
jgi:hypothetical protein